MGIDVSRHRRILRIGALFVCRMLMHTRRGNLRLGCV